MWVFPREVPVPATGAGGGLGSWLTRRDNVGPTYLLLGGTTVVRASEGLGTSSWDGYLPPNGCACLACWQTSCWTRQ